MKGFSRRPATAAVQAAVLLFLSASVVVFLASKPWDRHLTDGERVLYDPSMSRAGLVLNRLDLEEWDTPPKATGATRILLITLDTLRADHLSMFGYPKNTSPFLDSLATNGVVFTRAFAPAPKTMPSHSTVFTALYPIQHRVVRNGLRLSRDVYTMTEALADSGFLTAGFVSINRFFREGDVAQGFAFFDEPTDEEQSYFDKTTGETKRLYYRPAEHTVAKAVRWLEDHKDADRLFVWVHLFDSHLPYVSRRAYLDPLRFKTEDQLLEWIDFIEAEHGVDVTRDNRWFNRNDRSFAFFFEQDLIDTMDAYDQYDAEIRYRDYQMQELFREIERLGTEFLTIVVADHGEGLGSHGHWKHEEVYNEQIRVPLVIVWPDGRYRGRSVETVVELTDIMPTVLYAAGVDAETIGRGRRMPIEGTPLQRLLEGSASEGEFGYAFSQGAGHDRTFLVSLKNSLLELARYPRHFEPGSRYVLLNQEWKYSYGTERRDGLYDLRTDFGERQNRIKEDLEIKVVLGSTLVDLIGHLESTSTLSVEEGSAEMLETLRNLGYIR